MSVAWTVGLLLLSNCFMTTAWYGHLKHTGRPLWHVIIQECIALAIFMGFAALYLGEGLNLRYLISFGLIVAAVVVAFYK